MPGAKDAPPLLPVVEVKAASPQAPRGVRKIPGAPASAVVAFAFHYKSDIFSQPGKRSEAVGYARRGAVIPVARRLGGKGCKGGAWYELKTGGAICTKRGFTVGVDPSVPDVHFREAALERPLIFSYARQKERGTPRLYRLPTAQEQETITGLMTRGKAKASGKAEVTWPEVVERAMDGAFLLALDRVEVAGGRRYYRTVRGRYIQADQLLRFPVHPMHGEVLGDGVALPLAFVRGDDRPAVSVAAGKITNQGKVPKHARFQVTGESTMGGTRLVQGASGLALRAEHVRVARKIPRPEGVGPTERWIHVSLDQQTLVAYQGDEPKFATLVSSGKEGYDPPLGTFPIYAKHLSVTMNATDAIDGFYEVEEVPWTMYYWESFALHGAYWHNDFGKPKSHGCTNLAPPDARWLFHWSSPTVPPGWNAKHARGTTVHYSR